MALVYTTPVLLQMNALRYVDRGGVHALYRAMGLQVGAVVVKAGHDENCVSGLHSLSCSVCICPPVPQECRLP